MPEIPSISRPTEWQSAIETHRRRARRWTEPTRRRRGSNQPHPVEDFLFTYYRFSLSKLEQWHPEFETRLEASSDLPGWLQSKPYIQEDRFIIQDPSTLSETEIRRLHWIHQLLESTRDRRPILHCHGLHEWAMVYQGTQVRHASTTPLRLSQSEVDAVVESRPIQCSHFDAFRFFPDQAQPLNRLQPSLMEREHFEQPACVHANMDLYKWSFKCMPWVGSDLLLDCFELALQLRDLDMRASPYDLSAYGLDPIPIETAGGRRQYEQEQQSLAALAVPLRDRLIRTLERLLAALPSTTPA